MKSRTLFTVGFLGLALLLTLTRRSEALYIQPDIVNVPVATLIDTLSKRAAEKPNDTRTLLNLARLHAMSYALKEDSTQILKGKEQDGPFFGYEPKPIPFSPKLTKDEARQKKAEADLVWAIETYAQVVKLAPDMLEAHLGLAWTTEQAKKKDEAVTLYRALVEKAWAKEKEMKTGPLGWHPITGETASYLIPLLDSTKDKAEIDTLKSRVAQLQKIPRPITPIAIPLKDGLGAHDLIDSARRARFDADGTGLQKHWSWIGKDVAWLVHDPKHTGKITSSLQWFGHRTFNLFFSDGYQAMSALDANGDGWLTGAELEGLALWQDVNGNGVSDPGEVKSLTEWGILSLSVRGARDATHPEGFLHSVNGVRLRDGTTRTSYDVILQHR